MRRLLNLVNESVCGECFSWAAQQFLKRSGEVALVHAKVKHPWDGSRYWHAWVEDANRVYDWQTMVTGASKWAGQGWPKDEFYEVWQPTDLKRYTEPVGKLLGKHRHYGPWHK